MKLNPKPDNHCFGCGGGNPHGMKLSFELDEERQRVIGRFCLGEEFQGGSSFLHGGIIALLLDEVMSKVSRFHGQHAVTADLRVEYKRPIRVKTDILVEGFMTRREGRQLYHEGEIRSVSGDLLARGEGRFVVVDRERYASRFR